MLGTLLHLLCYRKVYLSSITHVGVLEAIPAVCCVFAELE